MQPAVIPQSMIAERHRLGVDGKDEMWEGVLHMNEPGSFDHHDMEGRLSEFFGPSARRLGLRVLPEAGVFDPEVPDYKDYRTADVVLASPDTGSRRGVEGRAALVIEIRSPGDDSFEKIPFYGRVGVAEFLIIDRDTKEVRRWLNLGGQLDDVPSGEGGWHDLQAVPVALRGRAGVLEVRIDDQIEPI